MRERFGDILIGFSLAVFPLLPTGSTYLGYRWPWALEVFFLAMGMLGLMLIGPFRIPLAAESKERDVGVRLVRIGYLTWLIPVVAGTAIGLLGRSPADWEIWRAQADGLLVRLGHPMHQVADPYYPLRIGLIYLEGGLAFWLLSAGLRRTSQPGRRVAAAIDGALVGVGLVSTIAIVQYLTRANLMDHWVRANPDLTRSHSTLDDPNGLASFLVLGIGLAGGVAWPTTTGASAWRRSVGPLMILALAGAALVTTVSRAGLVSLVIAGVVCAVLARKRGRPAPDRNHRVAVRGGLAIVAGAILIWMTALVVAPRVDSDRPRTPAEAIWETFDWNRPLDSILKGRLRIWKAAAEFGMDDLPLGIGVGQFPRLYSSYPGADGPENAHNFFLQVFAEGGLLGMLGLSVWLATIGAALRHRHHERDPAQRSVALWLSVGTLAFVLTWATGHPLLNLSNQLWFAAITALGLAALRER